jgi:hypothetical protein
MAAPKISKPKHVSKDARLKRLFVTSCIELRMFLALFLQKIVTKSWRQHCTYLSIPCNIILPFRACTNCFVVDETHDYSFWAEGEKHLPFFSCTSKHFYCTKCLCILLWVEVSSYSTKHFVTIARQLSFTLSVVLHVMIMMTLQMSNECLYECKEWCDEICKCMTRTHMKQHPDSASP